MANKHNDFELCKTCLIKDTEPENEICHGCDGEFYRLDEESEKENKGEQKNEI